MACRRSASTDSTPTAKRVRLSTPDLEARQKSDLVTTIRKLEEEVSKERDASQEAKAIVAWAGNSLASPTLWLTLEQSRYISIIRPITLIAEGIKTQMLWHKTSSSGSDKFSVSIVVRFSAIFRALTRQTDYRLNEVVKIPMQQFNDDMRYKSLTPNTLEDAGFRISSEHVTMEWNETDSDVTVSGRCAQI